MLGLADAAYDSLALLACVVIFISLVRIPSLVGEIRSCPLDAKRGRCRYIILKNFLLVFVDALCLPCIVLLVMCPWRWKLAYTAVMDPDSSLFARRWSLLSQALSAVIDIPVVCAALVVTLLNPFRCTYMLQELRDIPSCAKGRGIVCVHLLKLVLDIVCGAVLLILLATPWRFMTAAKDVWKSQKHIAIAFHLGFAILDVFAGVALCLILPSHRACKIVMCCDTEEFTWHWSFSEEAKRKWAHCELLTQLALLIVDIFTCLLPFFVIVVTVYRLPVTLIGLSHGDGRECICRNFVWITIEIPIMVLSLTLLVTPWRMVWLIQDVSSTHKVDFRRLAVFYHVCRAVADLLALASVLLLVVTAPHRFFSKGFLTSLKAGFAHIGKSANTTLSFRQPDPRVPSDNSTISVFHGTSEENARSIERDGFRPSVRGMLGPGVYVSRDPSKAESYGRSILQLSVNVGRVAVIEYQRHPHQTTWNQQGYDAAWVPAGCGMVPSNREEGCIFDASRVQVVGRYTRMKHPHLFCLWESICGIVDLVVCIIPMLILVLSVYRLPFFIMEVSRARNNGAKDCALHWLCYVHAAQVLFDMVAAVCLLFLMVASPWRCVLLVVQINEWAHLRAAVILQLGLGVLDPFLVLSSLLVFVSGYRVQLLKYSIARYTTLTCQSICGALIAGPQVHVATIWQGCEVFLDILCLTLGVLVSCTWRSCTLWRHIGILEQVPGSCSGSSTAPACSVDAGQEGSGSTEQAEGPHLPSITALSEGPVPRHEGDVPIDPESPSAGDPSPALQPRKMETQFKELEAVFNNRRLECARTAGLVLSDLFLALTILIVILLMIRACAFFRRARRMVKAYKYLKEHGQSPNVETHIYGERRSFHDAAKGKHWLQQLDGDAPGKENLSLTFFLEVIMSELVKSIMHSPFLILAPIIVFFPFMKLCDRYVHWRLRLPPRSESTPPTPATSQHSSTSGTPQAAVEHASGCRLPSCFFAGPVPWLIGQASHGLSCLESEQYTLIYLGISSLMVLHELATLLYLLHILFIVLPLTFGRPCWTKGPPSSSLGKAALTCGHVVQALLLPAMIGFSAVLGVVPTVCWSLWLIKSVVHVRLPWTSLPEWPWLIGQIIWLLGYSGALQLLYKTSGDGSFNPSKGARWILFQTWALLQGTSIIWTHGIDPLVRETVRCSYRHRRTCGCLGELMLAMQLILLTTWPIIVAIFLAPRASLGLAVALFIGAGMLSTFLAVHAVRITKANWAHLSAQSYRSSSAESRPSTIVSL